ncbi:MAG: hypothetical protein CVV31_12455 [Methanomicrobiales archaeon HGW-Methanomicrobiales-2]|jgi:dihydropyrimidine dehydrogenase (NAD+) subunit PreA|nr:MAG: hypothetical protein CVV35_13205 [Methanomicrobiales archaeon HGW-Methanomicrobiales-6]PKL61267.1 MAG: hypothetical protein CVV31_12455 [Methanomicrobiales archaeon HGW-Methanomicrobiales-2]
MWEGAGIVREMNAGLSGYLADKHVTGVAALKGCALPRSVHRFATLGFSERCTSCGRCVTACRDGGYHAISIADRHVVIDRDRCDGCSLCSYVCPEGVIVMLSGS